MILKQKVSSGEGKGRVGVRLVEQRRHEGPLRVVDKCGPASQDEKWLTVYGIDAMIVGGGAQGKHLSSNKWLLERGFKVLEVPCWFWDYGMSTEI